MYELNRYETQFLNCWERRAAEASQRNLVISGPSLCTLAALAIMEDVDALMPNGKVEDASATILFSQQFCCLDGLIPAIDHVSAQHENRSDADKEIQRRQHMIALTTIWIANYLRSTDDNGKSRKKAQKSLQSIILYYFFGLYVGKARLPLKARFNFHKINRYSKRRWFSDCTPEFQCEKMRLLLEAVHWFSMEYFHPNILDIQGNP